MTKGAMAFVTAISCSARPLRSISEAVSCKPCERALRTVASSAATLIISTALLGHAPALADDAPLVFDHDQSLSGANFDNRNDLRGAIFSKANCKSASFVGSDLTSAQLDDANFQYANLEGVTAVYAMATKTKFQRANLKDADFTNANLVSAQFEGANIEGTDFTDSLLDRATVTKLCKVASGINSKTGISTSESLMCPE